MFGFMIKKAFFDYWDNFFHMAILNIVLVFSFAIPLALAPLLVEISPPLSLAVMIIGILWCGVALSASSLYVNEIAQFRSVEAKHFFRFLKEGWKTGILFALIWGAVVLLVTMTFPFYTAMGNMIGLAAVAFLFWTLVIFVLSMQYYFPVRDQLSSKPGKVLKKMFIVFFDNALFSIGLFLVANGDLRRVGIYCVSFVRTRGGPAAGKRRFETAPVQV
jgi:hypothetical protein